MGQKGHAKWGGVVDSCLPYRTPDWKLETSLRIEESSIPILSFCVFLLVVWSNF